MILCAISHFFAELFLFAVSGRVEAGGVLTNLVELFNFESTLEAINKKQIEMKYFFMRWRHCLQEVLPLAHENYERPETILGKRWFIEEKLKDRKIFLRTQAWVMFRSMNVLPFPFTERTKVRLIKELQPRIFNKTSRTLNPQAAHTRTCQRKEDEKLRKL